MMENAIKRNYQAFLSDFPWEPLKITANTEREARHIANEYIRRWNLPAYIVKIEKITEGDECE